ncbi:hypothetical protein GY45DRAFT_1243411 [Cubamyces sp. BRFM 1775]|nr:hypothetical protein GY45DRAFT_1243411 [Cubamyces sp. BRFM 1775]
MLLPTHHAKHELTFRYACSITRTQWLCLAALLTFSLSAYNLSRRSSSLITPATSQPESTLYTLDPHTLPPTYHTYHEAELRLPQHDWSRSRPAPHEKFFFVAGHVRGLGWGNALQEHLLNAHLAYVSNRTFVFSNYTWNDDGSVYSIYNGKPIPSQIPYTVLIRGPAVGDPLPLAFDRPPAVSKDYFDHVCPQKFELGQHAVDPHITHPSSALEVTEKWSAAIQAISEPCLQSSMTSQQIYSHYRIFGIRGALADLWPTLSVSPILTQFGWSPLIERAFDENQHLFYYPSTPGSNLTGTPYSSNAERYTPIPGLMAVHVRRGDYLKHCVDLTDQGEDFVSINTLPGLADPFVAPRGFFFNELTRADRNLYRRRCFPSVAEIVQKVEEVRATREGRGIRRIYIMTNGKPDFISELKEALLAAGSWDSIHSSRDMVLSKEEKYVAQAVDMLVAQRAQVFIGNGFSTLTSGAVMMRLSNGFPVNSTRFW